MRNFKFESDQIIKDYLEKYEDKYGDCIIDEIMFATNNETTADVELAEFLDSFHPIVKAKFDEVLRDDVTEYGGKSYTDETLQDFLCEVFLEGYIANNEVPTISKINTRLMGCGMEKIDFSVAIPYDNFIEWYFYSGSDDENKANKEAMMEQMIEKMFKGQSYDIQSLFESTNLESFPLHLCVEFEDEKKCTLLGDNGAYLV